MEILNMEYVYIIQVTNKSSNTSKVSQEGYATYEQAEEFIKSRVDNPVQESPRWCWHSDTYMYEILCISCKRPLEV